MELVSVTVPKDFSAAVSALCNAGVVVPMFRSTFG